MKKHVLILFFIFIGFPLLFLTSCKKSDNYVGLWLTLNVNKADETKFYSTVDELEKARIKLNVEYYVDGYSSTQLISHLNKEVPYYFSVTYHDQDSVFYSVIDVYYGSNGYYLENNDPTIPTMNPLATSNSFTSTRIINNQTIYLVYKYEKLDEE